MAAGTTTSRVRVSIVLPTKNRHGELVDAVASVFAQTRLPEEFIIVDQSTESTGALEVDRLFRDSGIKLKLDYVLDPAIQGANQARNVGIDRATGEMLVLMEDDIVLEESALSWLIKGYEDYPDLIGLSGVITNYATPSFYYRVFDRLFAVGPFHDERQPLYWNWSAYGEGQVVRVRKMGGFVAFRRDAISAHRFDEKPKPLRLRGEDRDFCYRLSSARRRWVFGMAMGARLEHRPSSIGRHRSRPERLLVLSQHYFFAQHLRASLVHSVQYSWWLVGLLLSSSFAVVRRGSLDPWRGLLQGIRELPHLTRT